MGADLPLQSSTQFLPSPGAAAHPAPSQTPVQLSNYIAALLRKSEKIYFFSCCIDFQRIPEASLNLSPKGEQPPRAPSPAQGEVKASSSQPAKLFCSSYVPWHLAQTYF